MIMFFELTRDNDSNYPWWVLVFFLFFFISLLFLRRMNFPRWIHPVHYFLSREVSDNSEVIKSIEKCRKYFHVGVSTTVGALMGFIFWLSPFLRSYPFEFYHEGMHLYIQVNRTCRLLLDKLDYLPPGSFAPCTDQEVARLSYLFNRLSSDLLKLSAQVSRLEDPSPFLWSSLFWFVPSVLVLLTFVSLAIRGPRRGVFVFVIPVVTQVPPTFWVRFFFPLIFASLVGAFLWGWRQSGKDFFTFNQELHFPPGTDSSTVVTFFNRLKWFLLATGLAPLIWMGLDFWWVCSCSRSYLFPELNITGLSQVPCLLDHLHDCILGLRVQESTREDLLLRYVVLEDEFYRLSGYLLQLDEVIHSVYPNGVILPGNHLTLFLRRGWGVLSLLLVGGLLFLARGKLKGSPRQGMFLFFFFKEDGFLQGRSFFLFLFVLFFLFVCLIFKLKEFSANKTYLLTQVIPKEHWSDLLVEEFFKRFREITKLAIAVEVFLWREAMLVIVEVSFSALVLLFCLITISKINLVCYRTSLFYLNKFINPSRCEAAYNKLCGLQETKK